MDFGLNSSVDLYKRLTPALNSKVKELKHYNINNVKKEDIWNYLMKNKWDNVKGLALSDMVDDILNSDNEKIKKYLEDKQAKEKKNIVEEEIELL